LVVMADVDAKHMLELAATEDQQPIEALATGAADPALEVRVRVRCPYRRADDRDALACEGGVEGARELLVPVVDQEPHPPVAVVEVHQQVARRLGNPAGVGVAGAGEVLDPAAADREEDQYPQAPKPERLHGEEVSGQDRFALRAQERAPLLPVALWRRRNA